MFPRFSLTLFCATALALVTVAPAAAAQGGRTVPTFSAGMTGSISRTNFGGGEHATTITVPTGTMWVDWNATDNWQIEFPLSFNYTKVKGSDSFTSIGLGFEPHYFFGRADQDARPFLGLGGMFNRVSGGGDASTLWTARAVGGVEIPIASDFRLRTDVFYQRFMEKGFHPENGFGLDLGANCYFGDDEGESARSPFNLRVGTDLSFDRFKGSDADVTRFNLPSLFVGGFVPLDQSEQFQLGGEASFSHISLSGSHGTQWLWRPTLEYNIMPGYLTQTGFRLQGFAALNHMSASGGPLDVSGTQVGFGGGAAVTFPMLGHLGSVGADWTHFQDNSDLVLPSSNQIRVKFEMQHRLHF